MARFGDFGAWFLSVFVSRSRPVSSCLVASRFSTSDADLSFEGFSSAICQLVALSRDRRAVEMSLRLMEVFYRSNYRSALRLRTSALCERHSTLLRHDVTATSGRCAL